jgi:hypothetical protein
MSKSYFRKYKHTQSLRDSHLKRAMSAVTAIELVEIK